MATLTTKPLYKRLINSNRIVLPAEIMKKWRLGDGDYVQLMLSPAGDELYLRPVRA